MPKKRHGGNNHAKVWHRLPGEPHDAWHAYRAFRDLPSGTRNFRDFIEVYDLDAGMCRLWREEWMWDTRIAAWDSTSRKRLKSRQVAALKRMRDRHAAVGADLVNLGARYLAKWHARNPDTDEEMPVAQIVNLVKAGVELERVARDMPSDIQTFIAADRHTDISKMDSDDLKMLKLIKSKMEEKGKEEEQ